MWLTWFGAAGIRAAKLAGLPVRTANGRLTCGPASQGSDGTTGALQGGPLSADWDIAFHPRAAALDHLRPPRLYRAPLPRAKATSPVPDLGASGRLVVDGAAVDLTGWTGMLGHNWGAQHAARWIWLRTAGLDDDGAGWLDVVLGRVRVGPVLTPWTAFGALQHGGATHRVGGLLARGTAVQLRPDGADIGLSGSDVRLRVRARVDLACAVAWEYADPSGARHEVVNSSVATVELDIRSAGRTTTRTARRRGVLEIGGDTRALDVPLQPYRD